jgi:phosphoribosylglycinamide formyltransferase 1
VSEAERPASPLPLGAAVFASGGGSNLQSLLDAESRGAPWRIRLLVTDREGVGALDRASAAGVESRVVPVAGRSADEVGEETLALLSAAGIGVIFLAGYLRLVPRAVVSAYARRILNVHPALLPAFGGQGMWGRHVHEAVLAAGCRVTGATVHFVDERYDEGTIVAQWPVPVLPGDSTASLAARVLVVEHRLYPLAAAWVCRGLAEGDSASPFSPHGEAWDLCGERGAVRIETLFEEAFPEP